MRRAAKGRQEDVSQSPRTYLEAEKKKKSEGCLNGFAKQGGQLTTGMELDPSQTIKQDRSNLHQEDSEWVVRWPTISPNCPWKHSLAPLLAAPQHRPAPLQRACLLKAESYQHSPGQEDKLNQAHGLDSQREGEPPRSQPRYCSASSVGGCNFYCAGRTMLPVPTRAGVKEKEKSPSSEPLVGHFGDRMLD